MPNSTCDLASFLASANDGDAPTAAAHATRTVTGTFMVGYRSLYRTRGPIRASHMPRLSSKKWADLRDSASEHLRKTAQLSSSCLEPSPGGGYNRGPGGRAPRVIGAAAAASFLF